MFGQAIDFQQQIHVNLNVIWLTFQYSRSIYIYLFSGENLKTFLKNQCIIWIYIIFAKIDIFSEYIQLSDESNNYGIILHPKICLIINIFRRYYEIELKRSF